MGATDRERGDRAMEPTMTDRLTDALRAAADAHHLYEQEHGTDPDWPRWYAEHMTRSLAEDGYRLTGPAPG